MNAQDPFAPLSKKRKVGYVIGASVLLLVTALLLGLMEGGYSALQLLQTACVVSIPCLVVLGAFVWLSSGKKSEGGFGPANVKVPIRLLKALPYLLGIVALFYLVQMVVAF